MFRRILVPLDGSKLSEQALALASDLARMGDAELILLHMPERPVVLLPEVAVGAANPYVPNVNEKRYLDQAFEYVNELKYQPALADLEVTTVVLEGDIAETIVDVAREEADLIVMSTHGRSGMSRWLLGSVTEKVLRHAPCPVIIARDDSPIRKILMPVDGSPLSEQALPYGFNIAETVGAEVTCLIVIEPALDVAETAVARLGQIEPEWRQHMAESHRRNARMYLETVAKSQMAQGHEPNHMVTIDERAADGILDYADKEAFDLIVMSTHGRSGINRWVYGSVTEKVMRHAPCHVMVVRSN